MKRFYRLKSEEAEEEQEAKRIDYARGEGNLSSSGSEDEGSDDESEVEEEEMELGGKRKMAYVPSDSESDSDDGDHLNIDLSEEESAFPPEMDGDDEDEEEEEGVDPTTRMAIVNLDWDNLRAGDLYTIFNSFLKHQPRKADKGMTPPPGKLLNVRIYPSEFGKERMAMEDAMGPGGGIFKSEPGEKKAKSKKRTQEITIAESEDDDDEDDDEEVDEDEDDEEMLEEEDDDEEEDEGESDGEGAGELEDDGLDPIEDDLEILSDTVSEAGSDDVDMDKLRQYQLERLRYYYAVATFSTVEAAELVHNELNGTEFERTANILDLSFVPEGMEFAEDELHDEATKEPKTYKGNEFVTDALRHSKVKLTWDQDDPNRAKMTRRALTREEIEEEDFGGLVAASSDEEEEEEEEEAPAADKKTKKQRMKERKDKLRALLLADDDTGDIWGKAGSAWQDELADLKGKGKKEAEDMEITFRPGLSVAAAGKEAVDEENLTTLEKYQRRMKEKKNKKKEQAELRRAERDGKTDGGKDDKPSQDKAEDDFFGDSESEQGDAAPKKGGKKDKDAAGKKRARSFSPVDMDDPNGLVEDQSHHFSLKDHVMAEKLEGKKRKRNRKSKKQEREQELGPEGFQVDTADPRFAALYDEPTFAIDPTHPK